MATIEELNKILRRHEDSPAGLGHELRLNLSEIVLTRLRTLGWTQRRLAKAANKRESYITRIVHGQQNCSLDTVGEILYALGIRAQLRQVTSMIAPTFRGLQDAEYTHGEKEHLYEQDSNQEENIPYAIQETTGTPGNVSIGFLHSGEPTAANLGRFHARFSKVRLSSGHIDVLVGSPRT